MSAKSTKIDAAMSIIRDGLNLAVYGFNQLVAALAETDVCCAYCGEVYPDMDAVREHIAACDKRPACAVCAEREAGR